MSLYVIIGLICIASGVLSGVAGFGALIIMVPALLLMMPVDIIVPLGVLCGIATQTYNVATFRRHIRTDALGKLLLGSLPGIWVGSSLLLHLPEVALRCSMGGLLICYVLWSTFGKLPPPTRQPAAVWAYTAGFFSGAFGAAFGINGPPAIVYATRTPWSPPEIRAFFGVFCLILFIFTAVTMYFRGLIVPEVLRLTLLAIPACLAGSFCGMRIAARIQTAQYMRLVFTLLFIMGLSLCWPAVRQLLQA